MISRIHISIDGDKMVIQLVDAISLPMLSLVSKNIRIYNRPISILLPETSLELESPVDTENAE